MPSQRTPQISRRLPAVVTGPIRTYATVVGEVVWASNFALGAFEILFCNIANYTNFMMGRAIWHCSTSDSGQLQMLRAATEASDRLTPRMRANILWAVEKSLKLGELRNHAVHSATIAIPEMDGHRIAPSAMGTKPTRFDKLAQIKDLKGKFRAVRTDLLQVGQFVHGLWPHVAGFDLLPPIPRRPRLTSLPTSTQGKKRRSR